MKRKEGKVEKKIKERVYQTTSPTQSGSERVPCHASTKLVRQMYSPSTPNLRVVRKSNLAGQERGNARRVMKLLELGELGCRHDTGAGGGGQDRAQMGCAEAVRRPRFHRFLIAHA